MRYVVGIAGPAGGGKSTLVRELVRQLGDAAAVPMDSYQRFTREPLHRIVQWMARGADFDEFAIEGLPEHLERLKAGTAVLEPGTGREIPARKYIVFETHFGRAHRATGRLIDLLFWIDTPPDVALARNLKDLIDAGQGAGVRAFLDGYLGDVRRLRLMQRERVAAQADVQLDGAAPLEAMAQAALREIRARLP